MDSHAIKEDLNAPIDVSCPHDDKIKEIEEKFGERVVYCPFCGAFKGDYGSIQTFDDIFNTLNNLQKNLVYELVGRAMRDTSKA